MAAKRIPFRVGRQENEVHVVHLEGAIERVQSLFMLTETQVNLGHRIGRNVPVARNRFECLQHFKSLICPAQLGEYITAQGNHFAVATTESSSAIERIQGLLAFP